MQNDTSSTEVGATNGAEGSPAKERQLANIVRGTMPHPLVYLIRFVEPADAKEADVAKKYGTTTGKVADIRKNRNFAYIDEAFRPSAEAKTASLNWLKQVPNYDDVGTDSAVNEVEGMTVATESDAAALVAKRAAVRKTAAKAEGADGVATDAGGEAQTSPQPTGSKKGGGKKGGAKEGATPGDAQSLMQ